MTVVVLLGSPGAGKGTQAPVLSRHLGVPVLASGDLLRTAVARGTALGREADRFMSRGQLVLDGFPRTRVQAEALDVALAEAGRRVDRTIFIDVATEDLVKRMANRRICTANGHVYNLASNPPRVDSICDLDGSPIVQRPDDDEATVRARMQEQIPPLLEVVDHYRTAGVLQTVDGREPISDVSERVLAAIDSPTVVDVPAGSVEPA
jgi:adenylate kinase